MQLVRLSSRELGKHHFDSLFESFVLRERPVSRSKTSVGLGPETALLAEGGEEFAAAWLVAKCSVAEAGAIILRGLEV